MNDYLLIGTGLIVSLIIIVSIARLVEKAFDRIRSKAPLPIDEEIPLSVPDLPASLPSVTYDENILSIGSMKLELESVIKQVLPMHEIIIVLFDSLADNSLFEVSNLAGIDYSGNEAWRAKLPSGYGIKPDPSRSSYMKITSVDPLKSYTSSGFDCQIDPSSGLIIESVFAK